MLILTITDYIFILDPPEEHSQVLGFLATHRTADLAGGLPLKGVCGSDHVSLVAEIETIEETMINDIAETVTQAIMAIYIRYSKCYNSTRNYIHQASNLSCAPCCTVRPCQQAIEQSTGRPANQVPPARRVDEDRSIQAPITSTSLHNSSAKVFLTIAARASGSPWGSQAEAISPEPTNVSSSSWRQIRR